MTDRPVPPDSSAAVSPDALGTALREIVEFVDQDGWDRPPMLFALVPTATLAQRRPDLVDADDDSVLTPVAQEPLADGTVEVERVLATTSWPPMVAGAALIQEIVVLPPEAEADFGSAAGSSHGGPSHAEPDAAGAAARKAARAHPGGRSARLAVGALRDGRSLAVLHIRPEDPDTDAPIELRTRADLATELRAALLQTFDDD
ncbi:PPA1309 family protein [Gordonia sp. CPCC 206044]|uniref:PPA1309 family protein n=1 Tax=Gordonia sp. CPCC 206044 TaxID=3140793 RepID=UPI003AF345BF